MLVKRISVVLLAVIAGMVIGALGMTMFDSPQIAAVSASSSTALCETHHVPENQCTRCNPELVHQFKARGDWCDEHNLPESQCDLCARETARSEEKIEGEPQYESTAKASPHSLHPADSASVVSIFFPQNRKLCATDGAVVQFASVQTAERAGLDVQPVLSAPLAPIIEAPAEIVFDESRTRAVTTTVPALVVRWLAEPGQTVQVGQTIAELESPEMPTLKADAREANAEWLVRERERQRRAELLGKHLLSASEYEAAAAEAEVAKAHFEHSAGLLRATGFIDKELQALQTQSEIDARFLLRAPTSGMLVKRQARPGELLPGGTSLALVSDPEILWVEAQVGERDLLRIRLGQQLEFCADGNGLVRADGRVTWVAQFLDPVTRTGTVRAGLRAGAGQVRAGEFGRAIICTGAEKPAVVVPKDAVQWEGCCNVVFVQETPDRYRPRKVRVEPGDRGHYRITDGLHAGEIIVVGGSYLLKTELRKKSIGAGCCAPEPTS